MADISLSSLRLIASACLCSALVGCASVTLPPPTASADTVQKLRASNIGPASTGKFTLAPGKPASMDTNVGGLRGLSVAAPNGSYALYLRDVLATELKAAGLYDEKSAVVIDGQLTDSQVDAAISTGTGRLAARFTVSRAGKQVFDKELSVSAKWESSFVGAVAIPAALNQYTSFYKSLVAKLLDDPDFRMAVAK
jgi:hypothetical protein